jgi:methylmalonyl-CoA mutase
VDAAVASGAPVVVICSTDDTYPELVPPITKGLKAKNPGIQVVLAGYPKDQAEAHKEAGVDEFIYLGADAHAILSSLFQKIGVLK